MHIKNNICVCHMKPLYERHSHIPHDKTPVPHNKDIGPKHNDDPVPVANPQHMQPNNVDEQSIDDCSRPKPSPMPVVTGEDGPPPGNMESVRRGMSDSDRHRFWWSKMVICTVCWDVAYLLLLPLIAETYPILAMPVSDDIQTFATTVTAIVTAGVILAMPKLPWPWNDK